MQKQTILDDILSRLVTEDCSVIRVSLVCTEKELRKRLEQDVKDGLRQPDVIERSIAYLPLYSEINTVKIDTSGKTIVEAAEEIMFNLNT